MLAGRSTVLQLLKLFVAGASGLGVCADGCDAAGAEDAPTFVCVHHFVIVGRG